MPGSGDLSPAQRCRRPGHEDDIRPGAPRRVDPPQVADRSGRSAVLVPRRAPNREVRSYSRSRPRRPSGRGRPAGCREPPRRSRREQDPRGSAGRSGASPMPADAAGPARHGRSAEPIGRTRAPRPRDGPADARGGRCGTRRTPESRGRPPRRRHSGPASNGNSSERPAGSNVTARRAAQGGDPSAPSTERPSPGVERPLAGPDHHVEVDAQPVAVDSPWEGSIRSRSAHVRPARAGRDRRASSSRAAVSRRSKRPGSAPRRPTTISIGRLLIEAG